MTRGPLTASCRALALSCGMYQKSDHSFVSLAEMPDGHLINAYLKALSNGDPRPLVDPLAAEVLRRGLRARCEEIAGERERRYRKGSRP